MIRRVIVAARIRLVMLGLACVVASGCLVAVRSDDAAARRDQTRQAVVVPHIRFRQITRGEGLLVAGRYAFVTGFSPTAGDGGGTLIDGMTGQQTVVPPSLQCGATALGPPWVAFGCGMGSGLSGERLFNVSTHRWRAFTPNSALRRECAPDAEGYVRCTVSAIGRDWAEITIESCAGSDCELGERPLAQQIEFQDLKTGGLTDGPDPVTGSRTTIANLNSPHVLTAVCSPLKRPLSVVGPHTTELGDLTFFGRFAVASYISATGPVQYLQRCGSAARISICGSSPRRPCNEIQSQQAWTDRAVMWSTQPGVLDGVWLPTLQRFRATGLQPLVQADALGAAGDHIFVVTETGAVLSARIPKRAPGASSPSS